MAERPVVNASPLMFLVRVGLLDLLLELGEGVVVPAAVEAEVAAFGASDPVPVALKSTPWIEVAPALPVPSNILAWDLGDGESAVLAWALAHPSTTAIIDDLAGRRCAVALGIPVVGTLGLVLRAKKSGRIVAARPIVVKLQLAGMYLADDIRDAALALVGE